MAPSLTERDKKVIWHPYTPQKYAPDPIPIVKGEGVYLVDEANRTYIDAISSWWVTIHGHGHPYIAEKIYQQAKTLEQVIFAGFTHEPAVSLAERLLEILPGNLSRIFYSDNGSTATEVAIKMAIQYWWNRGQKKRTRIIAFKNSYHGDTFGAMSISGRSIFTLAFQDRLFDVLFTDAPSAGNGTIVFEGYTEEQTETLLQETACVIYEPLLQAAGGMKMYEPDALNSFLDRCKAHDIICIADEVMTGFGRTGKLFASSYCTTSPDIICLSKGLTGGTMALGVTACTAKIHAAFIDDDKLKSFFHGHSFTANPIACTAALASLDLLQKKECVENIARVVLQHTAFKDRLALMFPGSGEEKTGRSPANHESVSIKRKRFEIKNIRQCGTIVAFEVIDEKDSYTSNISALFTGIALDKGVYLRPLGNTVYLMPPYCISNEDLDKVYSVIIDILEGNA